MASFRNRKLSVCYPSAGTRQAGFDIPLDLADIDRRHPQETPTFPTIERTREQTRGCSGEYIVKEELTRELMRLRYGFTPSAELLALWAAYAYGAAAAPTGTAADEVQTVQSDADGGTFTLAFEFEGLSDETAALPFDITAAALKAALERLKSIKPGNVNVAGTLAAGFTITFTGDLAKANLPLLVLDDALLANATASTVTQTTAGGNKIHVITRSTAEAMTLLGLVIGFEGDSAEADLYSNIAVNSLTVTVPKLGKATAELDLLGSAQAIAAIGYIKPACVNPDPIYSKDCRAKIGADFYTSQLFEMRWSYSNNIFTDDAQDWDSIDISNLERGDRTTSFSVTHYASPKDAIHQKGETEDSIELHFGRPGDRFSWFADRAKYRIDDADITFVGAKNKSAVRLSGEAFEDETTGEVDYCEANIGKTTAFLLT